MFIFSKLFWLAMQPSKLFWILGSLSTLGIVLPLGKKVQRLSKIILCLLFLLLNAIVFFPVDDWLAHPLEQRFPQPTMLPEQVDGIITLGGAFDPVLSIRHGQVSANGAIERVSEAIALHQQFPEAKLVYTGGSGFIKNNEVGGADIAKSFFADIGIDTSNIIFEAESRNTFENAVFSKALLEPTPNQTWILVTSAFHIPRSVGIFQKNGWNVIPYPVDYNSTFPELHPGIEFGGKLSSIDRYSKEYVGLIAYKLLGRTDSFFPKP